ncbi:hypothetical protein GWI96_13285 [Proteus sp. G4380]|nr:hypothetical protein [Proteus mirabilis]NBM66574.1 hypothetical protein [Proteus sp. G4390]NBN11466.1 hypothetical protein [Proteus sp. G4389]NBN23058.1 hypothetical protein [Proteus sp. G4399]NBN53777.1 hypothetical protein [Proteus sp. G4380]
MELLMPELTIRECGEEAIRLTNELFQQSEQSFMAYLLNESDLAWCIASTRNFPPERQLPWDHAGQTFQNDNGFSFCFKFLDMQNRPAGACICEYCSDNVLNIEMIQNFQIKSSILDGNTLKFMLYTIVFFLLLTQGTGVRLMFPINENVATYYVEKHGFQDLTGDGSKEILYRSAEDLLNWFEQNNRSVDSE